MYSSAAPRSTCRGRRPQSVGAPPGAGSLQPRDIRRAPPVRRRCSRARRSSPFQVAGQPLQLPRCGPAVRHDGDPPCAQREGPAALGLSADHPRGLSPSAAASTRAASRSGSAERVIATGTACGGSGCKGPATARTARPSTSMTCGTWPNRYGHPCIGCTEEKIGFKVATWTSSGRARRTPTRRSTPTTTRSPSCHRDTRGAETWRGLHRHKIKLQDEAEGEAKNDQRTPQFPQGSARRGNGCRSSCTSREKREAPADAVKNSPARCIGCKTCVVACKEANDLPADNRQNPLHDAPTALNDRTRISSSSTRAKGGGAISPLQAAVYALCRPRVCRRVHDRCSPEARARHRDLGQQPLHRLPLLPGGLPLRCSEVRVGVARIIKCELCPTHRLAEQGATCARATVRPWSMAHERSSSPEAHRRMENPGPLRSRRSTEKPTVAGRSAWFCRTWNVPDLGDESVPALNRQIQHGVCGLRRAGRVVCGAGRSDVA